MFHSRRDQLNRHLPFLEKKMRIISHSPPPLSFENYAMAAGNDSGISNWQLAAVTSWYELQAFVRHFLFRICIDIDTNSCIHNISGRTQPPLLGGGGVGIGKCKCPMKINCLNFY